MIEPLLIGSVGRDTAVDHRVTRRTTALVQRRFEQPAKGLRNGQLQGFGVRAAQQQYPADAGLLAVGIIVVHPTQGGEIQPIVAFRRDEVDGIASHVAPAQQRVGSKDAILDARHRPPDTDFKRREPQVMPKPASGRRRRSVLATFSQRLFHRHFQFLQRCRLEYVRVCAGG